MIGFSAGWTPQGIVDARTVDLDHRKVPAIVFENSSLKLVGTAVTGDPSQDIAIIENLKNRRQWSFHEGDHAGTILIKEIHRRHIVIDAGLGEKTVRLKSLLDRAAMAAPSSLHNGNIPGPSNAPTNRIGSRERLYIIDRKAVEAALSDPERVLSRVEVMPARLFNREVGFRIADFDANSIFSKMGLRSGDLLLAINEDEIAGPEQAASLFEFIREGGDIDLKVRRRARTYHINLLIQ